jgi:phosphoribosylamine--glycine ligase
LVDGLFCAPGNAGIAADATCVPVGVDDTQGLIAFCKEQRIEFVVVGPDGPIVAGLVDRLEAAGIAAFGPSAKAAALEGSKAFTKELCARHGIPTAAFVRVRDLESAKRHIATAVPPIVVKADGLALGKGVHIAPSREDAVKACAEMLGGSLGAAGNEIVLEQYLVGEELSFFALVHGEQVLPLAAAQDHKRVGDGDTGPNTGGMGAYSPPPLHTPALERRILDEIVRPTARAMVAEGNPYVGALYAGLMITADGPKLIEYNARFGDPECQVLMPRLKSDLLTLLMATRSGTLDKVNARWREQTALCVVMATRGYPGSYAKGSVIAGLDEAAALPDVTIFHAGTAREGDAWKANGGRVLGVTALGKDAAEAKAKAYAAVQRIRWPEGFYRRDVGFRAIART